jgi:hypothetical protein
MCASPCGNKYCVHSRSSCVCLIVCLPDSEVQFRHAVYPQWVSVLNNAPPPGGLYFLMPTVVCSMSVSLYVPEMGQKTVLSPVRVYMCVRFCSVD